MTETHKSAYGMQVLTFTFWGTKDVANLENLQTKQILRVCVCTCM